MLCIEKKETNSVSDIYIYICIYTYIYIDISILYNSCIPSNDIQFISNFDYSHTNFIR